jgi:hypothetical protein
MKTITIILLVLLTGLSQAQESYLYKRTNIKVGHSITPSYWNALLDYTLGNFRLETNQGVSRFVELGAYVGYSRFGNAQYFEGYDPTDNTTWSFDCIYSNAYSYGVAANFQFLPLITQYEEPRFDVYLSAKIGGLSLIAPERSVWRGHALDFGAYAGISVYITRHWGAFVEYGVNNRPKVHNLESCLRYGITVKF